MYERTPGRAVLAPRFLAATPAVAPRQNAMNAPTRAADRIPATLVPGDGIGPEITESAVAVLDALGSPFEWDVQEGGNAAVAKTGDPLPPPLLDSIRRTRLALKGPLTTPVGGGFRSVNVRLREEFKLYANVRPARTIIPGGRYDGIDLVLVRENLEGLYVGFEHYIPIDGDPHAAAISSGVNTRAGSRRIAEFAFDYAVRNGRRKVTIVHKANVLKALTGIFLETAREVAKRYEGRVACDDRIVDACAMQLVLHPWQFDMILTTNLFGDILSDEIAGLVGGLGMAPGGNIGEGAAIFEAVHGSAPDIAGKGIANPTALLLAAAMMLDHAGKAQEAARLRHAIDAALNEGNVRTGDLGGKARTKAFTQAVVERLA
jgi:isocitrate dehydrogenase (NAD+)